MGILAEDFTPLKEPVTYFSKFKTHSHTVRTAGEMIIDGKVVKRPPLKIQFKDHKCTTRDPRIVEAMDTEVLTRKSWSNIMYKAPTQAEQDRAKQVAAKLAEARKKIIAEMGDVLPKPEVGNRPKNFQEYLKREEASIKKTKDRLVQGRRSVSDTGARRIQ